MKTITQLALTASLLCGFTFVRAQVPPTAPPDLAYPAENVHSFFSEKYGNVYENTQNSPNWGQSATWDYTASADEQQTIVIRNLSDKGWLPIALGGTAKLSNYYYVHIDVFCNEASDFRIGFQRHYPDNLEWYFPMIKKTDMVPGKWYSIDYSLDEFFTSGYGSGNQCVANYLRFGGESQLDGYTPTWSNEIYFTNFVLFNGEPTCLGGVVRDNVGIETIKDAASFNAYITENTLKYNSRETISLINVYNTTGQIVLTENINDLRSETDMSHLPAGVYVVAAKFASGKIATQRVVK